ncbi:MAG: hypothetical protein EOP06_04875 [Proteobacteria bacterium]|nr:MAG: hypothetical protein EOP06_04875 [Pseudomonadota bacterium]
MIVQDNKSRLASLLYEATGDGLELPLIHITDAYSFVTILSPKKLEPQQCDVFGEPLTYLFYGRPAYRTKHQGDNFLSANLPVAMVFHPGMLSSIIKRVFPFDSGAFKLNLYSNFFHRRSELNDFELDGSMENAKKIVAYFYRSNEEYFHGGSRKNVEIPPFQFEAEGIFELARTSAGAQGDGKFKPDLRSSSIEIQTDGVIDINDALLALIIPQIFLDEENTKQFIDDISPKYIETYSGIHNISNESITGILFEKIHRIYKKEGII